MCVRLYVSPNRISHVRVTVDLRVTVQYSWTVYLQNTVKGSSFGSHTNIDDLQDSSAVDAGSAGCHEDLASDR